MIPFLERLDHQLFFALNQGLSMPLFDHLLWWVSVLADALVLTLAIGIGLWWLDRQTFKQHYGWLVFAVLAGGLLVQVLKYSLARPRPLSEFAALLQAGEVHINVIGRRLRHRSFPSGHTQAAASVFTYLVCLYPRRWFFWGGGILLVGLARVYLGVHFPSDVLAGALLGSLTAVGAWRLRHYFSARALGGDPTPPRRCSGTDVSRHS
jgi:undecaprenyl-diphosphatase